MDFEEQMQEEHANFERRFRGNFIYHNRYLKKRKFMLLACWTAKKRTISTRHDF